MSTIRKNPREWAIADSYVPMEITSTWSFEDCRTYFMQYENINPIHVIELSAYLQLQAELAHERAERAKDKEFIEFASDKDGYFDAKNHKVYDIIERARARLKEGME